VKGHGGDAGGGKPRGERDGIYRKIAYFMMPKILKNVFFMVPKI
jgi:hypothetical protein